VASPDDAHGLERDALGLRQGQRDEDGHDGDPGGFGGVVREGGVVEAAKHGKERLRLASARSRTAMLMDTFMTCPSTECPPGISRRAPPTPTRPPRHPEPAAVKAREDHTTKKGFIGLAGNIF
jgi:hypothetical protein